MVTEVNKLIYNRLITDGAIVLPDVGALYIRRYAATAKGDNRVVAPEYRVEFASQFEASSLLDAIVEECGIELAEAKDIYSRWLAKVQSGRELNIEGVGTLRDKSFVMNEELYKALNIDGREPIKIRKKGSKRGLAIASTIAAVAVLTLGIGYYIMGATATEKGLTTEPQYADNESVAEPIEIVEDVVEIAPADTLDMAIAEVEAEAQVEPEMELFNPSMARHKVVYGSYSTTENAERAIRNIEEKFSDIHAFIMPLGAQHAVVIFASDEREACEEFVRSHRREFPNAWVFTSKRAK